jgi:hypothetical protein
MLMAGEDGQPTQPGRVLDAGTITMTGSTTVSARPAVHKVEEGFPPATLPTIFADGIVNAAPSVNAMKFYLYRSDPEQSGKAEYQNQVVAQVVMPLAGFVASYVFLEKAVKKFISDGTISQELVTTFRQSEGS